MMIPAWPPATRRCLTVLGQMGLTQTISDRMIAGQVSAGPMISGGVTSGGMAFVTPLDGRAGG
jgi:hypothetical protein